MYRDQVSTVCTWFDRWTPCEQTVALVAMLRRVHPTQARFLTSILNRQTSECTDLRRTEILANDQNYLASLNNADSKEALMKDLLIHIPLLNPKNAEAKAMYLTLIPKVLKYVLDHYTMVEDARQLLSYCLIHPAFNAEDRGMFTSWLHQFDQTGSTGTSSEHGLTASTSPHFPHGGASSPFGDLWQQLQINLSGSPAPVSSSGGNYGTNYGQRIRRSNSLTPPVLHSDAWTSQEELCGPKPRSLSLSSEVSPQSSLASSGSGSETHLDDSRPTFTNPGMKDVPTWLKSLRLHKYAFLFAHLTFEEMLNLSEETLEQQGVTKGARHKIILSIGKLRDRVNQLKQLSEQMHRDKDSLRNALTELKWMLTTPIKSPYAFAPPQADSEETGSNSGKTGESGTASGSGSAGVGPIGSNRPQPGSSSSSVTGGDDQSVASSGGGGGSSSPNNKGDAELTTWIVHVIGKACELNPDMECEALLVSILDKCLVHEAFSEKQKRLMTLWRQQHTTMRRNSVGHPHFHHRNTGSPGGSSKHGSGGNGNGGRQFSPRVLNLNNQIGNASLASIHNPWGVPGSSIHAMFMAKRPSLQDQILESARSHLAVQRTKSAPLPNFLAPGLSTSPPMTQFDHLNPLGRVPPSDFAGGLNFPDPVASLGLGHDRLGVPHGMGMGVGVGHHESGMGGVGRLDSTFNPSHPGSVGSTGPQMSAMDITSRLESLCLSMTEAALGLSCTNY